MAKLRILSGQQVCQILSRHGFEEIRQRGTHIIMQKKIKNSTITIPVPNHREIKTGTLMSIVRQSQLGRSIFESE